MSVFDGVGRVGLSLSKHRMIARQSRAAERVTGAHSGGLFVWCKVRSCATVESRNALYDDSANDQLPRRRLLFLAPSPTRLKLHRTALYDSKNKPVPNLTIRLCQNLKRVKT